MHGCVPVPFFIRQVRLSERLHTKHPRMPSFPNPIATSNLRLSDVPEEHADWQEISRFALTYDQKEGDPYSIKDQSFDLITADTDLVSLRSRLFFEQRRWNHYGRHPDTVAMENIRKLVFFIREKLK
jgi:hypothetical protein